MQMNDTDRFSVFDDKELGNAFACVVHGVDGFGSQNVRRNGFRIPGHDVVGLFAEHVGCKATAQVTVGNDAEQAAVAAEERRAEEQQRADSLARTVLEEASAEPAEERPANNNEGFFD